jgi:hypothetical protein
MEKDMPLPFFGEGRPSSKSYCPMSKLAAVFVMLLVSCPSLPAAPESPAPSGSTAPVTIVIGTPIRFNAGGESERYRAAGWSKTEKDFTWSEGPVAKLDLPIPADAGLLTLSMKLGGLTKPPTLESQAVQVLVNGRKIADWQVAETADFTARIPTEVTKTGGILTVELRLANATSPKALGLGDDGRLLGIRAYSMELKRE